MRSIYTLLSVLLVLASFSAPALGSLQDAAQSLVICAKEGKSPAAFEKQIAQTTLSELSKELSSDEAKLAFWMNVYNGSVQNILIAKPELFNDRNAFFKAKQINVAGKIMSLDDIEHGMIRKSKVKLSLGFFGKLFVSSFERKLRVQNINPRIHFALNCGAKSCPPVAIYDAKRVTQQLDASAKKYLTQTTSYKESENKVIVTTLFSWFRGDFGGLEGVKEMLKSYTLIPANSNPNLEFADYDWTLDTGNFIEL